MKERPTSRVVHVERVGNRLQRINLGKPMEERGGAGWVIEQIISLEKALSNENVSGKAR